MKSRLGRARVPSFAAVAACVLAIGAGWAIAASTTSSATLRACANEKTGALRLAGRCTKSERRVSWNTVGPRGSRGIQGIQGVKGAKGETGAKGESGAQLFSGRNLRRSLGFVLGRRPGAVFGREALCRQ
jgi:hypothetical protein